MTTITLNYDATDTEFYACNCGIISKLAEEIKYRVEDEHGNESTISRLETIEFEYWGEADSFEFWSDCVDIDPESMNMDELKKEIETRIKLTLPRMGYDEEIEFIKSI